MSKLSHMNTLGVDEKQHIGKFRKVLTRHQNNPGGLIPILQEAQSLFGYLPIPVLKEISLKLNKPYSVVAGVVSFYSFFSTVPRGRHVIRVCLGTACYVRGGKRVLEVIKQFLGIDLGETTEDKRFSLEIARCFGACGLAPVMMVDDDIHQSVKPSKVQDILTQYK